MTLSDGDQGTKDLNEPRGLDQEGLSPNQVKEAVTLVRDHLVQSVSSSSSSSSAWPVFVNLVSHDQVCEGSY